MQILIEFVFGMCLLSVIPIMLFKIKENQNWKILKERGYFLYELTILNAIIFFLFYQNTEMVLGLIVGSCLFRLLIIGGVSKLIFSKSKRLITGQYLVFCTILVLFLSADYLLARKRIVNCINQVDALLLIFAFFLYIYMVYGKEWIKKQKERKTQKSIKQNLDSELIDQNVNILRQIDIKQIVWKYILVELSILIGVYLLEKNIPMIGATYGVSQYKLGMTVVSWGINLSGIYLSLFDQKTEYFIENAIEETIVCMTLALGIAALVNPIMISQFTIYDLMIFSVIAILMQFSERIDNRFSGSGMITIYIGFLLFVCVR